MKTSGLSTFRVNELIDAVDLRAGAESDVKLSNSGQKRTSSIPFLQGASGGADAIFSQLANVLSEI